MAETPSQINGCTCQTGLCYFNLSLKSYILISIDLTYILDIISELKFKFNLYLDGVSSIMLMNWLKQACHISYLSCLLAFPSHLCEAS